MSPPISDPLQITRLLQESRTIAVVGLSPDSARPSHVVSRYMKAQGYRIIPINPNCSEILTEVSYPSLLQIPTETVVEIVNLFRRSNAVVPFVEQAVQIGARCVWMQEGVINPDAARVAEASGLIVVMNRCIMKDHQRYIGQSSPPFLRLPRK